MSTTIDTKVAQLKFDNSQFEKGINDSLKDIDKLNKSLKFDQASDGILEVNKAIKGMNFNPVSEGITLIQNKFSMWEQMAIGAARRIGENLEQFVGKTLKELSGFNNLTEGYNKYDTILESTNVLVSATGKSLEEVEDRIETLSWYSDETSYNLNHMTDALSKFANAGVDIDDATYAIQGIASWAAASGVNAQKASSAFYNLSQAMGAGYLGGMDEKSLELLNMVTPQFKEIAIGAGIAAGKVEDLGDGLYKATNGNKVFSVESLKESLSDKWLDVDVLTTTLNEYGKYSKDLLGFMDQYPDKYDTANEAMKDFDEQLKAEGKYEEYVLSRNAFLMAQQAKTFKDAIDATKDAASTKWFKIIKSIVGDLEEAKELWTNVSNELYNVFVGPLDTLSDAFKMWHNFHGRDLLLDALGNLYDNIKAVMGSIGAAFSNVFGTSEPLWEKLMKATTAFRNFIRSITPTEEILNGITKALTIVLQDVKFILSFIKPIYNFAKSIIKALWGPLKDIASILLTIADVLNHALKTVIENTLALAKRLSGYISTKQLELIGKKISKIISAIKTLVKTIAPQLKGFFSAFYVAFNGVTSVINKTIKPSLMMAKNVVKLNGHLTSFLKIINDTIKRFKNGDLTGYLSNLGGKLGAIVGGFFNKYWPKIVAAIDWALGVIIKYAPKIVNIGKRILGVAWDIVKWVFSQIPSVIEFLKGPFGVLKDFFFWLLERVEKAADAIGDFIEKSKPLEALGNALKTAGEHVAGFFENFQIGERVQSAIDKIKEFFDTIRKKDDESDALDDTNDKLENQVTLLDRLREVWENFKSAMASAWGFISEKAVEIWQWLDNATGGGLTKLIEAIQTLFEKLGSGEITIWDIFLKMLAARTLFKSVISLVELIKNPHTLAGTLKQALQEIGESLSGIGVSISGFIDTLGKAVSKKAMSGVFKDIANALLKISIALIALSFVETDKLEKLFPIVLSFMIGLGKVAKDFLKGTSALADATGGLSEAKALKNISKTFTNIAKAVLILVAALWVASKIDEDKARTGMSTIIILMTALRNMVKAGQKGNFGDTGKQIKAISNAMLVLVAAVFLFGSMDSDRLATGLIAVILLLKMFEKFVTAYNNSAKGATRFDGVGKSFKQISKALLIMVASVYLFGSMPLDKLIAGCATVGILMAAMLGMYVGISASRKRFGGMTSDTWKTITNGFVKMAAALIIVATGMALFSVFPASHILAAGGAMALILVAMAGVYAIIAATRKNIQQTDPKIFNKLSAGFVILGAALLVVANGMLLMGAFPADHILAAGFVMTMILMAMAGVYAIVAKINKSTNGKLKPAQFAGFAASMILLSSALSVVAAGILLMGTLPLEKMIAAGIIMAGILGLMATIMALISNGKGGSGGKVLSDNSLFKAGGAMSLLAMAGAVAIIAAAMIGLGNLGSNIWPAIGGLVAIVAALVVLSKFAGGLDSVGNGMLKFFGGLALGLLGVGAAILLIAIAAKIFNSSLVALAAGIALFAAGGEDMSKGAKVLCDTLTILIVGILDALAVGIVEFCRVLVEGFVELCKIVLKGIKDLLIALNDELPGILEELTITFAIILAWIADLLPGLLEWLGEMIHIICDWLIEEIPIIFGYLAVLIPEIVAGLGEAVISILLSLSDWINENKSDISNAIWEFIVAVLGLLWEVLTGWGKIPAVENAIQEMFALGDKIFSGLWDGMKGIWESITGWFTSVKNEIVGFVSDMWDALTYTPKDWDKLGEFFTDRRVKQSFDAEYLALYAEALEKVGDDFENDTQRANAAADYIRKNQKFYSDEEYDKLLKIVSSYITYSSSGGKDFNDYSSHHYSKGDVIAEVINARDTGEIVESYWDKLLNERRTTNIPIDKYYNEMEKGLDETISEFNNTMFQDWTQWGAAAKKYGIKRIVNNAGNPTETGATIYTTSFGDVTVTMSLEELAQADSVSKLIISKIENEARSRNIARGVGSIPTEAQSHVTAYR